MTGGSNLQWFRARPARAAVAAVVFIGLSGGAAYATSHHGSAAFRQALIADAAKRLSVTPARLTDAIQQARIDQVNRAVAAGKLTRAQGNAIIKGIRSGRGFGLGGPPIGAFGFHPRRHFGPMMHHRPGPAAGGFLSGAATYLGLSNTALFNDLRSGKTLADVAGSKGKSVAGLQQAMLDAARARLDVAVQNGFMTRQQEQRLLTHLKSRIDTFVTRGFQFHHRGPWHAPSPTVFFG